MSRILVLTAYTKNIEWNNYGENDFSEISATHNKEYADLHGYDFIYEVLEEKYKDFYPTWIKIPTILKHLPNYDYVCWIDGDAIFTTKQPLDSFLGKNICLGQCVPADGWDTQFTLTSTGFMIFKNSEYSLNVLNTLLEQAETYKGGKYKYENWHEQGLLDKLFMKKEIESAFSKEKEILLTYNTKKLSMPLLTENCRILPHDCQECTEEKDPTFIYHACGNLYTRKARLLNATKLWNLTNL